MTNSNTTIIIVMLIGFSVLGLFSFVVSDYLIKNTEKYHHKKVPYSSSNTNRSEWV